METRTRTVSIALCLAMTSSAPSAAAHGDEAGLMSEYTLIITGNCPGQIVFAWSGATPNRRQGVVYGEEEGRTFIPTGVCAGTTLGVAREVFLVSVIGTRDGTGTILLAAGNCIGGFAQLVENHTCRTSNVARVP